MVSGGRPSETGPLGMKRELRALDAEVLQLERAASEAQAALQSHRRRTSRKRNGSRTGRGAARGIGKAGSGGNAAARSGARRHGAPRNRVERLPDRNCPACATMRLPHNGAPKPRSNGAAKFPQRAQNAEQEIARSHGAANRPAANRAGQAGRAGRAARRNGRACRAAGQRGNDRRADGARTPGTSSRGAQLWSCSTNRWCRNRSSSRADRGTSTAGRIAARGKAAAGSARRGDGTGIRGARAFAPTQVDDALRMARQKLGDFREERSKLEIERARNDSEREHLRAILRRGTERAAGRPDRGIPRPACRRGTARRPTRNITN